MATESFIKVSFYRDWSNEISDHHVNKTELYIRELAWLIPSESQIYKQDFPSLADIELPPNQVIGGGGDDSEIIQLVIGFLQNDAVIIGIAAALANVIGKFIEREKDAEISIEKDGRKFTVKGRTKLDAEELLNKVFPELSGKDIKPAPSRLEKLSPQASIKIKTDIEITTTSEEPPGEWFPLGK